MSDISRMRAVFQSGQCIGHVLKHAKGFDAHDRDNQLLGTFQAAHHAANALKAAVAAST